MTVGFSGFPDGRQNLVPIPATFFSDLLPQIDHLVEMRVTLYCFWALNAQDGAYRYIQWREVCQDQLLLDGIKSDYNDPVEVIRDGFERAVARGTLLHVTITFQSRAEDIYFMNTEKGRAAVKAIEKGDWVPGNEIRPIALITERPNIFVLYEQNIGALTPLIAQQLRDLERDYSSIWLEEAIQIAALRHITNLNFIISVLKRRKSEGNISPQATPEQQNNDRIERLQRQLGAFVSTDADDDDDE